MRRGLNTAGVLLLIGAVSACHEHVALKAPTPDAPLKEREEAYDRLRALSYQQTHITYLRGGTPVGAERRTDYMQLADGTRVYYPEDILPVVPAGSPPAVAADRSASARTTRDTLRGVGITTFVVGGVVCFGSIFAREPGSEFDPTPIYIGLGAVIVGGIVYLAGSAFSSTVNDEAATAFETYDAGLRKRLGVCAEGEQRAECRAPTAEPAPSKPPKQPAASDEERPPAASDEERPPAKPKETPPEEPVYKPSPNPFGPR